MRTDTRIVVDNFMLCDFGNIKLLENFITSTKFEI